MENAHAKCGSLADQNYEQYARSNALYTLRAPIIDMGTIDCKRDRELPPEREGLADPRTVQRLAFGGSVGECPGRQENGA
jgi:hypothetical protein